MNEQPNASPLPLRTEDPPPRTGLGAPKTTTRLAIEAAEPGQAFDVPLVLIKGLKNPTSGIYASAKHCGKRVSIRKNEDGSLTVYVIGYRDEA